MSKAEPLDSDTLLTPAMRKRAEYERQRLEEMWEANPITDDAVRRALELFEELVPPDDPNAELEDISGHLRVHLLAMSLPRRYDPGEKS